VALIVALVVPLLVLGRAPGDDKSKSKTKDAPETLNVQDRKLFTTAINDSPAWKVTVNVDHGDRNYQVGDYMKIEVTSERDGYLYLFNLDPQGKIVCLFPNNFQKENRVTANQAVMVPDPKDKNWRIKVGDPTGKEYLKAIVITEPAQSLKLDELTKSVERKPLRAKQVKSVFIEAITGDPDRGGDNPSIQDEKDKFQQNEPVKYKQKAREWVDASVEINTQPGKGKPEQSQDKPKDKTKPEQGQDKPKDKTKPGQDDDTPKSKDKTKPDQSQDKPKDKSKPDQSQDKPKDKTKPGQDDDTPKTKDKAKPDQSQDKPKDKDKPEQSQDKPKDKDKPEQSQDKPKDKTKPGQDDDTPNTKKP